MPHHSSFVETLACLIVFRLFTFYVFLTSPILICNVGLQLIKLFIYCDNRNQETVENLSTFHLFIPIFTFSSPRQNIENRITSENGFQICKIHREGYKEVFFLQNLF
ncbi:hypothetical protein YC2023_036152 [Brassica napus]